MVNKEDKTSVVECYAFYCFRAYYA